MFYINVGESFELIVNRNIGVEERANQFSVPF